MGRPIRALDVVYTYQLARVGKWNKAWLDLLRHVTDVRVAPDGFDVVFELSAPVPDPKALLTVPLVPTGLHGPLETEDRQRPLPRGVRGAGPYKPAAEGESTRLIVNDNCLRKPRIAEVRILTAGSPALALDYVRLMGDAITFEVPPESATLVGQEFSGAALRLPGRQLLAIAYRPTDSPLGDPVVRKALRYLVHRPELMSAAEGSVPTIAPAIPGTPTFPTGLTAPPLDIVEAEKILWWEGGWHRQPNEQYLDRTTGDTTTERLEIALLVDADDVYQLRRASILRERLRHAGVRLIVDPRPHLEFMNRVRSREFPAALVALDLPADGNLRSLFHSQGGDNVLNHADPGLDERLEAGDFRGAARKLVEQEVMLFLGVRAALGVAGKNVQASIVAGRGGLARIDKWRIR